MKTKGLTFFLAVCALLIGDSARSAIGASQRIRPENSPHHSQPSRKKLQPDIAFDPHVDHLPPGFKGDDVMRLYRRLVSIPDKDEFESTEALFERLERSVDYGRYYAFVDTVEPNYDADQQKLRFNVSSESVAIKWRDVYKGTYRASNAFGVRVTVDREDNESYGLENSSRPSNPFFSNEKGTSSSLGFEFPAKPSRARYLANNLRVAYIGRLYFGKEHPTFTSTQVGRKDPTISSPTDGTTEWHYVHVWIEQVWVFDAGTGEVLSSKTNFSPRDDAPILPFDEEELRANAATTELPELEMSDLQSSLFSESYVGKSAQVDLVIGPKGNIEYMTDSSFSNLREWSPNSFSLVGKWGLAVRKWRFKPFYRHGRLVRAKGTLTYHCDLNQTIRLNSSDIQFIKQRQAASGAGRGVTADVTVNREGMITDVVLLRVYGEIDKDPHGRERAINALRTLVQCKPVEVKATRLRFITTKVFYFNDQYEPID